MPPKPLSSALDWALHGVKDGRGAVNRTSNDREGVVVLDGGEARGLIDKMRGFTRSSDATQVARGADSMKDLYQRIQRGQVNLTGDAPQVLNRYAFMAELPFMSFTAAELGAAVGRINPGFRAVQRAFDGE
ncbi:MAG: hypothetical protein RMA76_45580 [Deltaproteobacteria bacterium]